MTRGEAKQLIASLVFVLVVTVFLLAFVGIRNVTTQAKPDSGKKGPAVACGRLVESRDIARGMRLDCEFDPSYAPPPSAPPQSPKALPASLRGGARLLVSISALQLESAPTT
jgi:hypothetical protein